MRSHSKACSKKRAVASFRVGLVEHDGRQPVRRDLDRAEELELLPRQGGDGQTLELLADRAPVVGRRPLRELRVGVGLQRFDGAVELVLLAHVRFLERRETSRVATRRGSSWCGTGTAPRCRPRTDGRHRSGRRCRASRPRLRGRASAPNGAAVPEDEALTADVHPDLPREFVISCGGRRTNPARGVGSVV